MTEYLWVFCQLVMFHDPELALHLQDMGFIPGKFLDFILILVLREETRFKRILSDIDVRFKKSS